MEAPVDVACKCHYIPYYLINLKLDFRQIAVERHIAKVGTFGTYLNFTAIKCFLLEYSFL